MRSEKGKATTDDEYRPILIGADIRKLRAAESVVIDTRKQLHVSIVAHAEQVVVLVDETGDAQFSNIDGVAAGLGGEAVGGGMLIIASECPGAFDVVHAPHHTIRSSRRWIGSRVRALGREPVIGTAQTECPGVIECRRDTPAERIRFGNRWIVKTARSAPGVRIGQSGRQVDSVRPVGPDHSGLDDVAEYAGADSVFEPTGRRSPGLRAVESAPNFRGWVGRRRPAKTPPRNRRQAH